MTWHSPNDAMPWVGVYVAVASLICTLAMAADFFQGFRHRKLWFPCRFFTVNAAFITLIAIAMKLPVDLTTDMSSGGQFVNGNWMVRSVSIIFLFTMLCNFLPSLGCMDDKELFTNAIALGILLITIIVNMCITEATIAYANVTYAMVEMSIVTFFLLWPFWVALTVPVSKRFLEDQYQKLHRSTLDHQNIKFSSKELIHHVKKYWIMAETGNTQFVLASSPFSSASGIVCLYGVVTSFVSIIQLVGDRSYFWVGISDYKWSIRIILIVQSIGTIVGSIAPLFRCITTITYFNLSKEWSIHHVNMFRVEKHWTQRFRQWKHIHVASHIQDRHCKKVFNHIKNMILNFCIAFQIMLVVMCKMICLVPTCIMLLFYYICNSLLKRFREELNASNNNARSEIEEYTDYVLQIEEEAKLSKRTLRNMLGSITNLLHRSEMKQPKILVKFLEKSTGFNGVVEFHNDQVLPFYQEETNNCWSLIAVTLTAIALALPEIENDQVKGLLASMSEGLQLVSHIEETLNAKGDLVKERKTARRVWSEVEVYCSWLQIDLQKKARKGKTTKEILQWLGDDAAQIVIQFKRKKKRGVDDSLHNFIAASSMYRISQTVLLHCNKQAKLPTNAELFEWISTIIADILCACFTNLPRVITLKCHHDAIERRGESIQTAARLLGKSKRILNILEQRQLTNLDLESMANIDKWHALLKSQIPNVHASSVRIQSPPSSSNKALTVTVI